MFPEGLAIAVPMLKAALKMDNENFMMGEVEENECSKEWSKELSSSGDKRYLIGR